MNNKAEMWRSIQTTFPILCDTYSLPFSKVPEDQLTNLANSLNSCVLFETIQNLLVNRIEKHVREIVVPEFWNYFKLHQSESDGFKNFYCAVELLSEYYMHFNVLASNIDQIRSKLNFKKLVYQKETVVDALDIIFKALLFAQMPLHYKYTVQSFYETALKIKENGPTMVENACTICLQEHCLCLQSFYETNENLFVLNLVEPLIGQILTDLIYVYIEKHIEKTCKDTFDVSFISANEDHSLTKWLSDVIVPWLDKIYFSNDDVATTAVSMKLQNFLFETYTLMRISQLFTIIIEYPESLPALEDISACLKKTNLRPILTTKLRSSMETRLLHPGVSTPDILTAYIAAIRSMRVLDSSGALLESITKPVHQYLRSRSDTIRCVVLSFIEEGPNDLSEELVHADVQPFEEITTDEEDFDRWKSCMVWTPDPVEVDATKVSVDNRRNQDIVSMLINVYGSKELFISEYRTLLADRLLTQLTCDTEKEIRYLELMKLRFGDTQLNSCGVMMKDIADSKRISHHIKQDVEYIEVDVPMNAIILSKQFWPVFKDEKLQLHELISEQMERFTKGFESLKGNRTLTWMSHLGLVDVEIELPDRQISLSVTPVHATIIMHFQDKSVWKLDELSHLMQVPSTNLRKKISFWQSRGLITETQPDVFELTEEEQNKEATINSVCDIVVEEEAESAMASAQDQREEELQTMWSYINGMLMNLDSMPLERIHQMLKMFAFEGPTIECSVAELRQLLDRKVRDHQLIYSGGLYRLPKS